MRKTMILQLLLAFIVLPLSFVNAQVKTVSADIVWTNQQIVLKNTLKAEYIIRIGDVDNLGFGRKVSIRNHSRKHYWLQHLDRGPQTKIFISHYTN